MSAFWALNGHCRCRSGDSEIVLDRLVSLWNGEYAFNFVIRPIVMRKIPYGLGCYFVIFPIQQFHEFGYLGRASVHFYVSAEQCAHVRWWLLVASRRNTWGLAPWSCFTPASLGSSCVSSSCEACAWNSWWRLRYLAWCLLSVWRAICP